MDVRRATTDEAERLWFVRNNAIRQGCRDIYDAKTIAAAKSYTAQSQAKKIPPQGRGNILAGMDNAILKTHTTSKG